MIILRTEALEYLLIFSIFVEKLLYNETEESMWLVFIVKIYMNVSIGEKFKHKIK